ncbi:MAG: DegT/DnrJ/EryC1/StrS family aminotransferase [Acidimicrobiales bacterium]
MTTATYVGGQFELDLADLFTAGATSRRDGIWTTTARTGLALIETALARESPRSLPVLLPSYVCDAVVQPFREAGRTVRFYRVDDRLHVDMGDLERHIQRDGAAAVLFVQYFGIPVDDESIAALARLRDSVRVIEDCAQGGLLEADTVMGKTGDFVITSLRKYLPVPDGALLLDRTGTVQPPASDGPSELASLRLAGQLLRGAALSGAADAASEAGYLELFERAEATATSAVPHRPMWGLSAALLDRIDVVAARERRIENYGLLHAAVSDRMPDLDALLPLDLPQASSPLVLPLRIREGRRDALRSALRRRGVFTPVHWPLPPAIDAEEFPEAARLSADELGLPVDQRYDGEQMGRVVDALASAVREAL